MRGVDLAVGAGEVLGVAGVAGNGQVELAEALAGVRAVHAGKVAVDGTDLAGAPNPPLARPSVSPTRPRTGTGTASSGRRP